MSASAASSQHSIASSSSKRGFGDSKSPASDAVKSDHPDKTPAPSATPKRYNPIAITYCLANYTTVSKATCLDSQVESLPCC